jgi:Tn3 transposase DDE domain
VNYAIEHSKTSAIERVDYICWSLPSFSGTVYLERAIKGLREAGQLVKDSLLTHLSPLGWQHINLTGDYVWHQDALSHLFTAQPGLDVLYCPIFRVPEYSELSGAI